MEIKQIDKVKKSTAISDYYFTPEHGLIIEFENQRKYSFPTATIELCIKMSEAESLGKFYNRYIAPLGSFKIS